MNFARHGFMPAEELEFKFEHLQRIISGMGPVLVAYSGGVDSTLVLKVAADTLAHGVVAVTVASPTTPAHELQDAIRLAGEIGAEHLVIKADELKISDFAANPENKCYICKKSRFARLVELARHRGISSVVDGENSDDRNDYRPGSLAARELGVISPLREAGITKNEVRALSRRLGLQTWNKPSLACLASRIPYGSPITVEKLRQIDAAEGFIRKLEIVYQVRVRHYGDLALIEVEARDIRNLLDDEVRASIVSNLKDLGFKRICVDMEGYRTGSMNEEL